MCYTYVNYVSMWFKYFNHMTFMINLKKGLPKILKLKCSKIFKNSCLAFIP